MSGTPVLFDGSPTEPTDLREVVGQALGAASVCWETPEDAGVFDSTRAKAISDEVVAWIEQQLGPEGPRLGLATTRQLLDELRARIEIDGYAGGGGLDYTTVGGRPERVLPAPGEDG